MNLNDNKAQITNNGEFRSISSAYRRYYHADVGGFDPGASGATYTSADGNTVGGWQLDAAGEILESHSDVHADWDGASDLTVEVGFETNIDNSGGDPADTVDLKLVLYYKRTGETVTKTQTVEVATVVGQAPRYKRFTVDFTIDWDVVDNVVEVGDTIAFQLNLETDTSEVDNIIINDFKFFYNTTHSGIESGDT